MGIIEQLDKPGFRPSKLDRALLKYIREQPAEVPYTAIAELAQKSGVGESTITRFAKKMGYDNLHEFKVKLAEELTQRKGRRIINSNIAFDESALVTGQKLLAADISVLEKTLASMPEGIVERCSKALMQAKEISFIGLGNSGFTAMDSAYKYFRIGLHCKGYDNSHDMIMAAALARPGDLFVAVSHSGESREVLQTVRLAVKNGAASVAITAEVDSSIARETAIVLSYAAKENLLETGSVTTKMAQFFVMDLIYTQIVKEMAGTALENKKKTALAMDLL